MTTSTDRRGVMQAETTVSLSGSAAGDQIYSFLNITDDWDVVTPASYETFGWKSIFTSGGTNSNGAKVGFASYINHSTASTPDNTERDHTAGRFKAYSSVNDSGTNTGAGARGSVFALDAQSNLLTGSTFYYTVSALKARVGIATTGSAANRIGVSIISDGDTRGATIDAALEVAGVTSAPGFSTGILFSKRLGASPLSTTGTLLASDSNAQTVSYVFDFSNVTATLGTFKTGATTGLKIAKDGNYNAIYLNNAASSSTAIGMRGGASGDDSLYLESRLGYTFNVLGSTMVSFSLTTGYAFVTTASGTLLNVTDTALTYQASGNTLLKVTVSGTSGLLGISKTASHFLDIAGGTTALAPIRLTAGTNLTTAAQGAIEFDGVSFYATSAASSRQVIQTEQFLALSGTYTLANSGAAQKLFNQPSNGSLTVQGLSLYGFECAFQLSSMSATSGNIIFDVLGAGNATLTSSTFVCFGADTSTPATTAAVSGLWSGSNANTGSIVVAATGTGMFVWIRGVIRVNAAGTLIPAVTLANAAAAVVAANSWFRIWPLGTGTVQTVGNWT